MREGFVFYKSFYESLKYMDAETFKQAIEMIVDYACNDIEPKAENPYLMMAFGLIKPQIDANTDRWIKGCKGGAPVGNRNNPKGKNQYSNKEDNRGQLEDNRGQLEDNLGQPRTTEDNRGQPRTTGQPKEKEKEKEKEKDKVKEKEKEKVKEKEKEREEYRSLDYIDGLSLSPQSVNDAFKNYLVTLSAANKTYDQATINKWIKALSSYAPNDPEKQIAIIEQSKRQGWYGIFPLKDKPKPKTEQEEWLEIIARMEENGGAL